MFSGCTDASRPRIQVFAAASLTDVMEVLADSFQTAGRYDVVINVAASSLLARQIEHGARADLFVSAHPEWTNHLRAKGLILTPDTLPISNRLVVVAREPGADISAGRIALADPEHVPAGMYAREALVCSGGWESLQGRIVPTVDVRAALAAVEEGGVEAAVVYASDALHVPDLFVESAVAERCQPDIVYTAGVLRGASDPSGARELLAYIVDPAREGVWRKFGFETRR